MPHLLPQTHLHTRTHCLRLRKWLLLTPPRSQLPLRWGNCVSIPAWEDPRPSQPRVEGNGDPSEDLVTAASGDSHTPACQLWTAGEAPQAGQCVQDFRGVCSGIREDQPPPALSSCFFLPLLRARPCLTQQYTLSSAGTGLPPSQWSSPPSFLSSGQSYPGRRQSGLEDLLTPRRRAQGSPSCAGCFSRGGGEVSWVGLQGAMIKHVLEVS